MGNTELLMYPIGRFKFLPEKTIQECIENIEQLPGNLQRVAEGLADPQLDTTYRPGGWTLRQVIHHLPDSHMNAYLRFKMAVTEVNPVILPYNEKVWAECEDAKNGEIKCSLDLLTSLHSRWVYFLKSLSLSDFNRAYIHPEHQRKFELKEAIQIYAWHGEHHLQHIVQTITRNNWRFDPGSSVDRHI